MKPSKELPVTRVALFRSGSPGRWFHNVRGPTNVLRMWVSSRGRAYVGTVCFGGTVLLEGMHDARLWSPRRPFEEVQVNWPALMPSNGHQLIIASEPTALDGPNGPAGEVTAISLDIIELR